MCLTTMAFSYVQKYKATAYFEAMKGRLYGSLHPYLYRYPLDMVCHILWTRFLHPPSDQPTILL
jgi:hypothetical protein